jgi:hypothetical protein
MTVQPQPTGVARHQEASESRHCHGLDDRKRCHAHPAVLIILGPKPVSTSTAERLRSAKHQPGITNDDLLDGAATEAAKARGVRSADEYRRLTGQTPCLIDRLLTAPRGEPLLLERSPQAIRDIAL